ncbi:Endoplasmic reticulum oxidoreductin-1 [Penicillium sp. IBT 16267x]|nr:Endoplasmic reticulum oxidoreductin-1 [Penicillium sp. IBT 16267x]
MNPQDLGWRMIDMMPVFGLKECVGQDQSVSALKVLFKYDKTKNGENPPLRRTELVALINTLGRISHSLAAARSFHEAYEAGQKHPNPPNRYVT